MLFGELYVLNIRQSKFDDQVFYPTIIIQNPAPKEVSTSTPWVLASWYDYTLPDCQGCMWSLEHNTAASRDYKRGTTLLITNVDTNLSVEVFVNDYGPEECSEYNLNCKWADRDIDLSSKAFNIITDGHLELGIIKVLIEVVN